MIPLLRCETVDHTPGRVMHILLFCIGNNVMGKGIHEGLRTEHKGTFWTAWTVTEC